MATTPDGVAGEQNPAGGQNRDFEGEVTRVKTQGQKDDFARQGDFARRLETPVEHQPARRDHGYSAG